MPWEQPSTTYGRVYPHEHRVERRHIALVQQAAADIGPHVLVEFVDGLAVRPGGRGELIGCAGWREAVHFEDAFHRVHIGWYRRVELKQAVWLPRQSKRKCGAGNTRSSVSSR